MTSEPGQVYVYSHSYRLYKDKLYLFGHSSDEKPVTIMITDWVTTLDVQVKADRKKLNPMQLRGSINVEKGKLLDIVGQYSETVQLVGHELVDLKYFHCFEVDDTKFHRISLRINSYADFKRITKDIAKESFQIAESLQEEERFLIDYGLKPAQWLSLPTSRPGHQPAIISARASEIRGLNEKDVPFPIPSVLVATFDIETFSAGYKNNRMPDSSIDEDVIYCLSYILCKSDTMRVISKHHIAILDSSVGVGSLFDDITLVQDEEELLETFAKLITSTNPDIITGYNIFGFDWDYIQKRSARYGGFPNISRVPSFDEDGQLEVEVFNSKKWSGAGGSYHEYHYPEAVGRIQLDAYIAAKRMKVDFTSNSVKGVDSASKSHKLDDIGKFLVGETKLDISYKEQFRRYGAILDLSKTTKGALRASNIPLSQVDDTWVFKSFDPDDKRKKEEREVIEWNPDVVIQKYRELCEYCIQDSLLTTKVFHVLKMWIETRESSSILYQDPTQLWITGQTRKYVAQLFRETKKQGYFVMPPKQFASFKLQGGYVGEPMKGLHEDTVVVDFASMYPSIMMRYNICPSAFKQTLWNIPKEMHSDFEKITIPIERGLFELPGDYEIPEDFVFDGPDDQSFITNGNKTCYNHEYVLDKMIENEHDVGLLESYVNMICDLNKMPRFHKGKEEHLEMYLNRKRPGVIPQILERLGDERKQCKRFQKQAKATGDTTTETIYDQRQNAIKILMNSIYGIYGMSEGNFGFMEGSAATTYYGRHLIHDVNDFLVEHGCYIVYGDTDSSFFRFNKDVVDLDTLSREELGKQRAARMNAIAKRAIELVDELNSTVLRDPRDPTKSITRLEVEKIMNVLLMEKKKYIGMQTMTGDPLKLQLKMIPLVRGVALVRGDTLPFIKAMYKVLIDMVFQVPTTTEPGVEPKVATKEEIVAFYRREMKKLKDGLVPREMLILSKKLNQVYNSPSAPMRVYAQHLTTMGEIAQPGTKLSFLVVKGTGSIGQRYRPIDTDESVDYEYYHRLACNPLEQLLKAAKLLD
jgi:DNA polymerase elongation subunit (family B)